MIPYYMGHVKPIKGQHKCLETMGGNKPYKSVQQLDDHDASIIAKLVKKTV